MIPPGARQPQQVLNQALHSFGPINNAGQILFGILGQTFTHIIFEELAKRDDLANWFLQIVAGDVAEFIEFRISFNQLLLLAVQA